MCDSKERLIGYLYGDIEDDERRAFDVHLATCAECRDELEGLRATRIALASWTPAEAELGFQIVKGASRPPQTRLGWFRPAWGLAAAAVLTLAAGAAIANLDIRYGSDGLTIRTGWGAHAALAPEAQAQPTGVVQPTPVSADDVARLESRLHALETSAARVADSPIRQATTGPRASDADVLREVKQLLGESESRQERELALRVGQVIKDFERQRRIDMATIQQGLQTATGADAVAHRQMMDYVSGLYRVSQTVK